MTTSWGWIGPYVIVIVLAILVGPFLASLPLFVHTVIRPVGLNASQLVLFIADGICLLMLWMGAARARQDLRDNGRGQTFVRAILFPSALLLIVLAASHAYEAHGIPVLGPPKQPLYTWLVTGGLIGAASWLTFAWVRHVDALTHAFTRRPGRRQTKHSGPPANQTPDARAGVEPAAPAPARPVGTAIARHGGGAPVTLGRYQVLKELGRGAMGLV